MNVLVVLAVAGVLFILASRFYSRYIARALGEDPKNPTPAITCSDGRDYVPTRRFVVFAHHFSAIAGAGPILGPTMAILYGFVPAWLWVVFGAIFIGAVHDFTALFVSMREGGKSMAEVARKTLGSAGFNLFIGFTIVMIVLVTSSFLSATAISLTSLWPLSKLGAVEGQTFLKTVVRDGVVLGRIGGIAYTANISTGFEQEHWFFAVGSFVVVNMAKTRLRESVGGSLEQRAVQTKLGLEQYLAELQELGKAPQP